MGDETKTKRNVKIIGWVILLWGLYSFVKLAMFFSIDVFFLLVFSGLLIASSIGILMHKKWALYLMVFYFFIIALGSAGFLGPLFLLLGFFSFPDAIWVVFGTPKALVGVAILWYFTRPHVRKLFS